MSAYWTNFVKTGDPNGPNLPQWPVFDLENLQLMELGDTVKVMPVMDWREQLEWGLR